MTLSLDDVRNKRFRMARKSGYEVLEVDEFVDEIEESFAQLIEENQNLKKQVDALRSSDGSQPEPVRPAEPAPVAAPQSVAPPVAQSSGSGLSETIVVTTAKEASSAVVRLVELSAEQAEKLVAEANQDANRIKADADSNAAQVTADARTRAERLESEARVNAERLQAQTLSRSEQLDQEIGDRRAEMLQHLQAQRDQLSSSVRALRTFEASFRANLTDHLRAQINSLETTKAEPDGAPELASARDGSHSGGSNGSTSESTDGSRSQTPRLDALLSDQR